MSLTHVLTQFALESHVTTQNLPINPKADSAYATRSHCLLQCGYFGFRFVRYQVLSGSAWRTHLQIHYFSVLARIDFVNVYGLLHDLLW
jgi:hypothetical protein